ncbi:protein FAR1-RELATED SEQUENCE 4-like [Magnolia sinica]|uniref:protein FAR1-RELATED SEQUENCE 4-like n=1 Tax=Magnolia sinica TaxID=86752 RepID=UPI002658556D|nr:protein FAR1-RELATED SEQUENCE 4-like [Magnolia sinica]
MQRLMAASHPNAVPPHIIPQELWGEPYVGDDVGEGNYGMTESIIEDVEPCAISGVGNETTVLPNEGEANVQPSVGMEFESEEAVYAFYNQYARRVGFGITRLSVRRSRTDKSKIAGHYACSKHGLKVKKKSSGNPRPTLKAGCKAMIKAKRKETGKWVLFAFVKEHNHELCPGDVRFFRSHKKVGTPEKKGISNASGVKVKKNSGKAKQPGVISSVSFVDKERRILTDKERRDSLAGEDAQAALRNFIRKHALNPAFFYAIDMEGDQHPKNIFWADGRSRTAYTYFGDAVTFDTAYLTNKYNVPLVSFVGVNHHGQSVLLGCAILVDETKESFAWLFKTWLAAMSGRPPRAIITDQDRGIKSAVIEVFPETCHRLCLWQILKNVPEKLGHICKAHPAFTDKLNNCVYDSLTVEEFEIKWDELMKDFKLGDNAWVQMLYEERHQWVPVFLKDTFFGGMSTSQRKETVKSFFDKYVSPSTSLKEFLDLYEVALENWYEKEAQADFETYQKPPTLSTPSPFEKQGASVYTKEIFKKFQVEILGMSACFASIVQQKGTITTYMVKEWEDFEKMKGKEYTVMWNWFETRISCICRLFEFRGYLCRHALVVLLASGVPMIPSHYILKRWTKEMRNRHVLDECGPEQAVRPETMGQRYNDLCQRAIKFAEAGSLSEEMYNTAVQELQKAMRKLVIGKV